jgi:hypothetical protein
MLALGLPSSRSIRKGTVYRQILKSSCHRQPQQHVWSDSCMFQALPVGHNEVSFGDWRLHKQGGSGLDNRPWGLNG